MTPLVEAASAATEEALGFPSAAHHARYDADGNRLLAEHSGQADVVSSYDDNDRLSTAGATWFEWTENGNLWKQHAAEGLTEYGWDDQDRLVHAETPSDTLDFVYDADGLKQAATIAGVGTTRYVVDGTFPYAQVLEERTTGGSLVARYLRGGQLALQRRPGADPHWYLHDGLGSTRGLAELGSAPDVTDEWDYEGFGVEARRIDGGAENAWLFAGEQRQGEVALDYLRARWLAPDAGRALALDPRSGRVVLPATMHRYYYSANDPVNNTDPSGESFVSAIAAVGLAGLVVATTTSMTMGALNLMRNAQPLVVTTDAYIINGSGWTDTEALAVLIEASAWWAAMADIVVRFNLPRRIDSDALLMCPAVARESFLTDNTPPGDHVTVFSTINGWDTFGVSTGGKFHGKGVSVVSETLVLNDTIVLAHEWGHTFSLGHVALPSIMTPLGIPPVLTISQRYAARGYVQSNY